jgi:hypothetical protein
MRDMGDMRYGMKWDSHLGFICHIIPHIYNLIYKWEIWDEMGSCSISLSKNGRYGMKFGIEYGTSNLWQSYIMGKYNNKPGAKTGTIRGYRICRQSQSCLGQSVFLRAVMVNSVVGFVVVPSPMICPGAANHCTCTSIHWKSRSKYWVSLVPLITTTFLPL